MVATSQYYLLGAACIFFLLFALYAFVIDHKESIDEDFSPDGWVPALRKVGLKNDEIAKVKHDETAWYYDDRALCVGYGDESERCPRYENYCAGKKSFGSTLQQAMAIRVAIRNKGEHPECPLLYMGAN